MLTRFKRTAPAVLVSLAAAAASLAASAPAKAVPHCPAGSTAPICNGGEPAPKPKPVPPPPAPPGPAEPDVLFQMAPCTDAIVDGLAAQAEVDPALAAPVLAPIKESLAKEILSGVREAVSERIPSPSVHSVCAGGSQRVGVWSTPVTPAFAAAHLPGQQRLKAGERYALRLSRGFFARQVERTLQEPDVQQLLAGKKVQLARIVTLFPSAVRLELDLIKAIVAEVEIKATDTVLVNGDGSLGCDSHTDVDANAAADFGEFMFNAFAFLELGPGMDIQNEARSGVDGRRPGCMIAALAPRQFLRAPLPPEVADWLTPAQLAKLPPVVKIHFDATRAQGHDGAFEIGGTWNWAERAPAVKVDGNRNTGGAQTVTLPLRLTFRDLRGPVDVQVLQGDAVKATARISAAEMAAPGGAPVSATLSLFRKPDALASASYTVRVTDRDGFVAERHATWIERELPAAPCDPLKPTVKCPVTRAPRPEETIEE